MKAYQLKKVYAFCGKNGKSESCGNVTLTLGDFSKNELRYHHFTVPDDAIVDAYFQMKHNRSLFRFRFMLKQKKLYVQYFTYNEEADRYEEAVIDKRLRSSPAFSSLLGSVRFSGSNYFSFIINKCKKDKNVEY